MNDAARERRDVVAGGRRLEVLAIGGTSQRSPIVLLHEGLGSVALWKDVPHALAERTGRGVIAYSRYGYGASERLEAPREVDYMHREAHVVLPQLLDALGLERPVLFGHSDGASIALLFAGAFPSRVRALVLEAPHVFVEDMTVASIAQAARVFKSTDLEAKLSRYHDDAAGAFWGWNRIWLDPAFRSWNIERNLAGIAVPVFVVQGRDDEYGSLAQLHAIEARVHDTRSLVLDRCGHSPHRDRLDAVLDAIAAFLEPLG